MESHSTIIGIVIALVIIIPLILIQTSQKRQKKNSRKGFMEEASKHHLQVKTPDFWALIMQWP